jgi:hypothetical protein
MKLPIKIAASAILFVLLGLVSILVGTEIFAFFIDFAEWNYASLFSISAVVTITIGLPLIVVGLLSVWAAIFIVRAR